MDYFNYTVSDGTETDTAVITITVLGINDDITAVNDYGVVTEDATLTVTNGESQNISGSYDTHDEHSGDISANIIQGILVVFISVLSNLYLNFKIETNQLNNSLATVYLSFDILQLGVLFFFTGGITNPFIFLIIVPAVFSSQYLKIYSSIILVFLIIFIVNILTFYYFNLPHPGELHFHVPDYYLFAIPIAILFS